MAVNRLTLWMLVLALCCAARIAGAQETATWHSQDAVRAAAERALRAQLAHGLQGVELSARALDPRLHVRACPGKLEAHAAA